ncbi:unnamed protein product [Caenorhabditis brenneri]
MTRSGTDPRSNSQRDVDFRNWNYSEKMTIFAGGQVAEVWQKVGKQMASSASYGQAIGKLWASYGQAMGKLWASYGQVAACLPKV